VSYKAVSHSDTRTCSRWRRTGRIKTTCEPIDSITVECTKCGEVVEEIYNADEDNTPPLDDDGKDKKHNTRRESW